MKSFCLMASVATVLGLLAVSASADTIAAWNFENDAIAVNNSPAPSAGSGTASSIGMDIYPTPNIGITKDDVLQGTAGDTGVNGNSNLTQIWRVRGQAGSNGAANGWSSKAPIGSQGAVFAASTVGYAGPIDLGFDWYCTTQGEANLQLEYTTDGVTWNNAPINIDGQNAKGLAALNNIASPNTVVGSYISNNKLTNTLARSQANPTWCVCIAR